MNLNNIFKKVSGIALAGVITFAGFAGTAEAAPAGTTEGTNKVPQLTKTVNVGKTGYFGGGTFNFTINPVKITDANGGSYTGYNNQQGELLPTTAEITLANGDTTGTVNIPATVDANTAVGVYRFEVKEEASGISGMTDSDSTYYIDVFVQRTESDGREVAYYIVHDGTNKVEPNFENTLAQEDLVITKAITGNQSNKSDTFTFEITVTPADGITNNSIGYYVGETSDSAKPTRVTPGKNGSTVITLTNNVTDGTIINLTGLAAGDSVSIKETDPNNYGGYKVTASNTNVSEADLGANGVTATVNGNNEDITWTNSRTADIPTGLIENIAPFVIAIAAAGIVFFVYFKRDKEEELA